MSDVEQEPQSWLEYNLTHDWDEEELSVPEEPPAPKEQPLALKGPSDEWEQGWQAFLAERGIDEDETSMSEFNKLLDEYSGAVRHADVEKRLISPPGLANSLRRLPHKMAPFDDPGTLPGGRPRDRRRKIPGHRNERCVLRSL
jgi:hypothetical protein